MSSELRPLIGPGGIITLGQPFPGKIRKHSGYPSYRYDGRFLWFESCKSNQDLEDLTAPVWSTVTEFEPDPEAFRSTDGRWRVYRWDKGWYLYYGIGYRGDYPTKEAAMAAAT